MKIQKEGSKSIMMKLKQAVVKRKIRGIISLRRLFVLAHDNIDKTTDLMNLRSD